MSKFYKLKVTEIKSETSECVSVGFEVPPELKKEFSWLQGQYLTLRFFINGEELRRSYSICSAPSEPGLRIAVKKVKDGRISVHINEQLKAGDSVETMVPVGNFYTDLNPYNKKTYVLFAAGSGITPVISIVKATLNTESQAHVNLFYGNSDEDRIIFKKELDALQEKYNSRLKVIYTFSRPKTKQEDIHVGRMSKGKINALLKTYSDINSISEYFICGPGDMMYNVQETLTSLNVAKSKIHLEFFGVAPETVKESTGQNLAVPAQLTVICDGDEREVFLEPHQTVLEAALEANLDAPFACRAGSCCTCRAKLIEG
jgi:ring-1,2-phenylacetyl-CoA epoxidase subunit PaaE